MHKIFAKTQFLGKNVVFLPQCHSTNDEAKAMNMTGRLQEGAVVWSDYQERGKGQQGNAWVSERGKNLLFTLLLKPKNILPQRQFLLNVVSSMALYDLVRSCIPEGAVEIKWPNDIYVNDKKIAGILTETVIANSQLVDVYCGIGLNVNQSYFNLPNATSIAQQTGRDWDRASILEEILQRFEYHLRRLNEDSTALVKEYEDKLRWIGENRFFQIGSVPKSGIITGIDPTGKLIVQLATTKQVFDVKEIEFLY